MGAGFSGCIILVVLAIRLGVWFVVKREDGQECTSSSTCSSGICDHNECKACKDIGTTSLDCLMHSFSDTSGQARADCYDICADKDDWCRRNCDLQTSYCVSSSAGFQCKCKHGYSGTPCVDIDECLSCSDGSNGRCPCKNNYYSTRCFNTQGGYLCVDWCYENDDCDQKTENCVPIASGFKCECKDGYSGNPWVGIPCVDINECSSCSGGASNDCPCDANEVCINTEGSFECGCSPPSSCEFSVSSGYIVDAFILNGDRYGKSSQAPGFESYSLNPGETLNEVQYGTCAYQGIQVLSNLYFRTSAGREFGPFGECGGSSTSGWEVNPFIGPYTVALNQARIGEQISTVYANDGYRYVTSFSEL